MRERPACPYSLRACSHQQQETPPLKSNRPEIPTAISANITQTPSTVSASDPTQLNNDAWKATTCYQHSTYNNTNSDISSVQQRFPGVSVFDSPKRLDGESRLRTIGSLSARPHLLTRRHAATQPIASGLTPGLLLGAPYNSNRLRSLPAPTNADGKTSEDIAEQMFTTTFWRCPTAEEMPRLLSLLGDQKNDAYEVTLWSLLNSTKSTFNR